MSAVTTSTQAKVIRLLLLLLLVGLAVTTAYQLFEQRKNHYQVQVIRNPDGWGYDILNSGKPFIHQPTIPGAPGMVAFSSQEQARRVGERVVEKIEQTEALPTLTNEELRQLGVKIP
jgi:hypothetical protein